MKIEDTLIEKNLLRNMQGGHYPSKTYRTENAYLTVAGAITGCGLAQMYGVAYIDSEDPSVTEALNQIKKDFFDGHGAGGILATLGGTFMHKEKHLLKLGFKKIAEYPNWHHYRDGSEIQTLYILNK